MQGYFVWWFSPCVGISSWWNLQFFDGSIHLAMDPIQPPPAYAIQNTNLTAVCFLSVSCSRTLQTRNLCATAILLLVGYMRQWHRHKNKRIWNIIMFKGVSCNICQQVWQPLTLLPYYFPLKQGFLNSLLGPPAKEAKLFGGFLYRGLQGQLQNTTSWLAYNATNTATGTLYEHYLFRWFLNMEQ